MLKKAFVVASILLSGLLLSGCSLKSKPAALQINTTPSANVFVDGKLLGKTPFSTDNLKAGEITVKLIPESTAEPLVSWEGKIKLVGGVLTLVDREFAAAEVNASGQTLSLEKVKDKNAASISVVTDPDGALVKIDGETKGFAPLSLDGISPGDHEIVLTKENYKDKSLRVKNILGYRLIVEGKLGQNEVTEMANVSITPTPTGGKITVSVTPTAKVTPKASPTVSGVVPTSGAGQSLGYILVKENSLGFLRVRSGPSGSEIAQIKPIDPQKKYPLLEEKSGWYKITYEEGKEGWVTADTTYTEKATE